MADSEQVPRIEAVDSIASTPNESGTWYPRRPEIVAAIGGSFCTGMVGGQVRFGEHRPYYIAITAALIGGLVTGALAYRGLTPPDISENDLETIQDGSDIVNQELPQSPST